MYLAGVIPGPNSYKSDIIDKLQVFIASDIMTNMIGFNDYQQQALKSVAITEEGIAALAHRTMGLSGEAGIISNEMKKVIRDKQGNLSGSDVRLLEEKLGDVLYYVAVLADYAGLTLEEIASKNLDKSTKFKEGRL